MVTKSEVWSVVLEHLKTKERLKPMTVLAGNYLDAIEKVNVSSLPLPSDNYRVVKVERLVDIIV